MVSSIRLSHTSAYINDSYPLYIKHLASDIAGNASCYELREYLVLRLWLLKTANVPGLLEIICFLQPLNT